MQIDRGRTLGIVGESGSGKSSLALGIMGLAENVKGDIQLLNINVPLHLRKRDKETLATVQMVFQNLGEIFSPYLTVGEILGRPLRNLLGMNKITVQQRAAELLDLVKLPVEYLSRYPRQLSGGEKQRVAIAQAFAVNPELLIADEPVSALDVSVQASILALLNDLQRKRQSTALLISHDIAVVAYLADDVAVFYRGQFMQFSDSPELIVPPFHPYTAGLVLAAPKADPTHKPKAVHLEGEIPGFFDEPTGCPFHNRCPLVIDPLCKQETPPWQITPDGKRIFCHISPKELEEKQKEIQLYLLGEDE